VLENSQQLFPWRDKVSIPKNTLTHCRKGHEWTPENTRVSAKSNRNCLACMKERSRRWYRNNDGASNAYERNRIKLLRKVGWTVEAYNIAAVTQNELCAICKKKCPSGRRLAADHDHVTGKARELLCVNCNSALGSFFDDPALLGLAIAYLKKHSNTAEQGMLINTAAA
jgi:Recombination endonuclease VII